MLDNNSQLRVLALIPAAMRVLTGLCCVPCSLYSPEYNALKEDRSAVLWNALEKVIPDIRQRAEVRR